jgi:hypothetical protein
MELRVKSGVMKRSTQPPEYHRPVLIGVLQLIRGCESS